jgi:hypothetical protein
MDRDRLFLETVGELRTRSERGTAYDWLMCAGLIRKLLMDGNPLVHQVNRGRRERLIYRVTSEGPRSAAILADRPTFWARLDGISPRFAPPGRRVLELKLEQFMQTRALVIDGRSIAVRKLIKQAANIEGGIHAGRPEDEEEQAIAAFSNFVRFDDGSGVGGTLRGITWVVLDGLEPIEARVKREMIEGACLSTKRNRESETSGDTWA